MTMATNILSVSRTSLFGSTRAFLLALPQLPALSISASIHFNIPLIFPGVWDSILRAVPKKKQSHSRRRMRQLVGKALQDTIALNNCPACGEIKRANVLCKHCVEAIKDIWRKEEAIATP